MQNLFNSPLSYCWRTGSVSQYVNVYFIHPHKVSAFKPNIQMCSLLQLVREKVSPAGNLSASVCPYLKVSLCGNGSGHVIEDKCARVNCSVLQIPFPNEPIDQKTERQR